jgi:hypothetical protein
MERTGCVCQEGKAGITEVLRPILSDPYAVAMRSGARLSSVEFTLLSRSSPTGRTSDGEHLSWAEFFCHTTSAYKRAVN